jgi:hypothetical protein
MDIKNFLVLNFVEGLIKLRFQLRYHQFKCNKAKYYQRKYHYQKEHLSFLLFQQ